MNWLHLCLESRGTFVNHTYERYLGIALLCCFGLFSKSSPKFVGQLNSFYYSLLESLCKLACGLVDKHSHGCCVRCRKKIWFLLTTLLRNHPPLPVFLKKICTIFSLQNAAVLLIWSNSGSSLFMKRMHWFLRSRNSWWRKSAASLVHSLFQRVKACLVIQVIQQSICTQVTW